VDLDFHVESFWCFSTLLGWTNKAGYELQLQGIYNNSKLKYSKVKKVLKDEKRLNDKLNDRNVKGDRSPIDLKIIIFTEDKTGKYCYGTDKRGDSSLTVVKVVYGIK
jgi:hypothetical protein